ncbi:MAG: YIP1 family protein [Acidobacteria bacterium]|nr:YIP1 family protein [Acidobacteriota bacterium]MBI3422964.1 YIP1 family protein [Acidobacteriota bacterium]
MEAGQNLASPVAGAAAPETEPKPQNFFARLTGVLFSPGETFAEIGRAPRVLIPLICLAILGGVIQFSVTNRFGYENIVKKQIEMQGEIMQKMNVPEDRIEEAKKQAEAQLKPENVTRGKVRGAAGAAFGFLVMVLIVAGVFKLFTAIMGASNTFKGVLSAVCFAYLAVGLVHLVVTLISIYLKSPEDIDVMNPVASNLGAILTMAGAGLPKFVTGLASFIDVFSIWRIVLLAIGCAAVTHKMKAGTAAIPHVVLYVLAALVGSFFASMMG